MLLVLFACSPAPTYNRPEPSFLSLSLSETAATGTADSPLPFTSSGIDYDVTVQALDAAKNPYSFSEIGRAHV